MELENEVDIVEIDLEPKAPLCKLCGKKLRRFRVSKEYDNRCYHKKCFQEICDDVRNFHQIAFHKYGYIKKFSNGKTQEENLKSKKPWIVHFD
jgi:hypothetical protein